MSVTGVLIVSPELGGNGLTRFVLDLAAELVRLGVRADVHALREGAPEDVPFYDPSVPVTTGFPRGRRNLPRHSITGVRLLRAARRADVVVSGWDAGDPLVAAYLAGRASGRPVAAMVQDDPVLSLEMFDGRWMNRANRWAYPKLDAAICVSGGVRSIVLGLGTREEAIRIIPNGIHVERTQKLAAEPPPGWLPDGRYLVGVGRLSPEKGFDLLVEAHAKALAAGQEHSLVILGEGPERERLESLRSELGVAGTVLLPGFSSNPFPVVAGADAFVLPSRSEGWGLVLAEALAVRTPVVATACAGPVEVLEDGRYGELVEISADALADAVVRHLEDPEPLRRRAEGGYENAGSFSIASRARDYVKVFDELVSRR